MDLTSATEGRRPPQSLDCQACYTVTGTGNEVRLGGEDRGKGYLFGRGEEEGHLWPAPGLPGGRFVSRDPDPAPADTEKVRESMKPSVKPKNTFEIKKMKGRAKRPLEFLFVCVDTVDRGTM